MSANIFATLLITGVFLAFHFYEVPVNSGNVTTATGRAMLRTSVTSKPFPERELRKQNERNAFTDKKPLLASSSATNKKQKKREPRPLVDDGNYVTSSSSQEIQFVYILNFSFIYLLPHLIN